MGASSGIVYKGYLIWWDAFGWWVSTTARIEGFRTLRAAKVFIDRNPRQEV